MIETSRSLLERLRRPSDDAAWERLHRLYAPVIRRWLQAGGLDESDLDDLSQDILTVLAQELPSFNHSGRPGAFRAWLRTLVMNRLRNFWRSRRSRPAQAKPGDIEELEDRADALGRLVDAEHDRLVANRLMELLEPEFTPQTWRAFRRQVLDGQSAAETAEELGVSRNAVLTAKSRILRRLRREGQELLD